MDIMQQSESPPPPQTMLASLQRFWQALNHWFRENTFAPAWLGERWGHPLIGVGAAILSQLIVLTLRQLLVQIFPQVAFYNTLSLLSVAIIALSWGAGPSIVSTFLGATFVALFIVPSIAPPQGLSLHAGSVVISALIYLLAGFVIIALASQTERARRNAQALAASLEQERSRLTATFESIIDGVIVYDTEGRILSMNPAGQNLLARLAPPDTAPSPTAEHTGWVGALHDAQGVPLAQNDWPQFRILRGETLTGSNAPDLRAELREGGEIELNASGAPIRDQTGNVTGMVCLYHDVTERRWLERRTQEALEALLLMAEALVQVPAAPQRNEAESRPAPTEPAQRLVELTRRVFGCQRVSIVAIEPETELERPVAAVGLNPQEEAFWWNEQPKRRLDAGADPTLAPRLRAGEVVVVNATEPPYQGQPNPYNVQTVLAAPIHVGERLIGLLGLDYGGAPHTFTREEITLAGAVSQLGALVLEREHLLRERAEAQAKMLALQEATERMDAYLSIVSHELRTPVTSIKTSIQLMLKRIAAPASNNQANQDVLLKLFQDQQHSLQRTDLQIRRLTHLLDDLIDLSRIRLGKLEMHIEACDLSALVREMVEEERLTHPERTILVELPTAASIQVLADPNRIGQVLTNYLTNAFKYSQADQPVQVGLNVEGQQARVWVRDQGPGIPLEEQAHIWEPFHRVPGIEVKSGSAIGLGLGLHISKTMVEQQQGTVGVESTPGQGSTFWFTLPLARAREPTDDRS